jgi:hypothetical protein
MYIQMIMTIFLVHENALHHKMLSKLFFLALNLCHFFYILTIHNMNKSNLYETNDFYFDTFLLFLFSFYSIFSAKEQKILLDNYIKYGNMNYRAKTYIDNLINKMFCLFFTYSEGGIAFTNCSGKDFLKNKFRGYPKDLSKTNMNGNNPTFNQNQSSRQVSYNQSPTSTNKLTQIPQELTQIFEHPDSGTFEREQLNKISKCNNIIIMHIIF